MFSLSSMTDLMTSSGTELLSSSRTKVNSEGMESTFLTASTNVTRRDVNKTSLFPEIRDYIGIVAIVLEIYDS